MTDWGGVALGGGAVLASTVAAGVATRVFVGSAALTRWVEHHAARYEDAARALMWRVTGGQLLRLQVASCTLAGVGGLLQGSRLWLIVLAIGLLVPRLWLERCRTARRTRIEAQLDTWLLMLANALRVSPALADGLRASATLVPAPLRDELELTLKEYRLGLPLDRALEQMGRRLDSRLVTTAVALIVVARNAGGNLSAALETSAASLREMIRLEGVLRAKTAEGKAQATLIALIPFALVLIIGSIDPQFFAPLADTSLGQLIVCGSAALWLIAVALARRIVQPES